MAHQVLTLPVLVQFMSHPPHVTANRAADAGALRKDTSAGASGPLKPYQQQAVCTLVCYCRVSGVHWVLHTGLVVVGSFFTSGERSREEDCLTYLDHSCRTALQHRVKFVRTLTSQEEAMAKRNFKQVQGKNNKTPTDIHSDGEKKMDSVFQVFQNILESHTQK